MFYELCSRSARPEGAPSYDGVQLTNVNSDTKIQYQKFSFLIKGVAEF